MNSSENWMTYIEWGSCRMAFPTLARRSVWLFSSNIVRASSSYAYSSNLLATRAFHMPTPFKHEEGSSGFPKPSVKRPTAPLFANKLTIRHYNNSGNDSAKGKPERAVNEADPIIKSDGFLEDLEPSAPQKLKLLARDYGPAAFVVHIGISLTSVGLCYFMVEFGLPLETVVRQVGIGEMANASKIAAGGNFIIAYAIHKLFMPVRVICTLGCTPVLVKFLRRKGILKPHSVKPT